MTVVNKVRCLLGLHIISEFLNFGYSLWCQVPTSR